jgi:hypothetical protein
MLTHSLSIAYRINLPIVIVPAFFYELSGLSPKFKGTIWLDSIGLKVSSLFMYIVKVFSRVLVKSI